MLDTRAAERGGSARSAGEGGPDFRQGRAGNQVLQCSGAGARGASSRHLAIDRFLRLSRH